MNMERDSIISRNAGIPRYITQTSPEDNNVLTNA